MTPALSLRPARPTDVAGLARLYAASVRSAAPGRYTPAQVEAWAAFAGEETFAAFILDAHTLVAEREGRTVGFGGLTPGGRIASLYVAPGHLRTGVARILLAALLERARARGRTILRVEASELSRPVFERVGFRLTGTEEVERRGVRFTRYLMERTEPPRAARPGAAAPSGPDGAVRPPADGGWNAVEEVG